MVIRIILPAKINVIILKAQIAVPEIQVYRKYARLFDARMYYCMAHLIRDICFLAEHKIKKLSRWGNELLKWLNPTFSLKGVNKKAQIAKK